MSKHYDVAVLYLTYSVRQLNKHISSFGFTTSKRDYVFIYKDINLAVLGIDLQSLLKIKDLKIKLL